MIKKAFLVTACIFMLAAVASARGIEVSPASYTWENAGAGHKARMPVPITVRNRSESEKSYSVKALPPAEWISFSEPVVTIPPGSSAKVRLFAELPREWEGSGRSLEFHVEIKELAENSSRIKLACYPKITIRTKKK